MSAPETPAAAAASAVPETRKATMKLELRGITKRFGSFAAIYGLDNTRKLIAKALDGGLIRAQEAFLAARQPLSA